MKIYTLVLLVLVSLFVANATAASTIVYIHGMTRDSKAIGFSEKFQKKLGKGYEHIEFSWQEDVKGPSEEYFKAAFEKPGKLRFKKKLTWAIRKLFMEYIMDVVIYPKVREGIFERLHNKIKDKDVIFICHSFGCQIAYEYMQKEGTANIKQMITFGCNIPLFVMGRKDPYIPDVKWLNIWEENDVLSMPIIPMKNFLSQKNSALIGSNVTDKIFNSNNVFKSWNVGAHNSYWRSSKLIKMVKKELK